MLLIGNGFDRSVDDPVHLFFRRFEEDDAHKRQNHERHFHDPNILEALSKALLQGQG